MPSKTIFVFDTTSDLQDWRISDDVVMGGKSSSTLTLDADGYGVYAGDISLKNNGGFSSVRYSFQKIKVTAFSKISIKLRGDGKDYQFRVKADTGTHYSYIAPFSTSGEWQEIEIPLADMYPSFRGRRLDQANFFEEHIEQITFLIGNKKEESFKLLIDYILLK